MEPRLHILVSFAPPNGGGKVIKCMLNRDRRTLTRIDGDFQVYSGVLDFVESVKAESTTPRNNPPSSFFRSEEDMSSSLSSLHFSVSQEGTKRVEEGEEHHNIWEVDIHSQEDDEEFDTDGISWE